MGQKVGQVVGKETVKDPQPQQTAVFEGQKLKPQSRAASLLNLQRTHGNRQVQQMLKGGVLQRKCACGQSAVAGGECAECAKNKGGLQRKLAIGASNDPLEREADRVADRVMATPTHRVVSGAPLGIQRYTGQVTKGTDPAPASVDRVLASSGSPLAPELRQNMEQRFGHDFSGVRVHTDPAAARSARDVNANAYTVGNNIVFGAGQFAPGIHEGERLVAHELTHVVQQGEAPLFQHCTASVLAKDVEPTRSQPAVLGYSKLILRRDSFVGGIANRVGRAIDPAMRQFLYDLTASVRQSPDHFVEFFTGDLLDTVKAHWLKIALVTLGLFGSELIIGGLEAAPTGITQIIGAILEVVVLAVLGYFAIVEVLGAAEEGMRWWLTARKANGDLKEIAEASRAFVRMVWHIFMAILAVAGVRARIRAGAVPRITAPLRPTSPVEAPPMVTPSSPPPLQSIQGGKPGSIKIRDGRVTSSPKSSLSTGVMRPVASSGEATARAFAPEPAPGQVPSPVREVPPLPKSEASSSADKSTTSPKSWISPRPFVRPDTPPEGERDEHGCTYQPIAMQFGRYPCHADYARSLSGQSREFRVTEPGGQSVDFDAMDETRNLYEVKTGYGWLWSTRADLQSRIVAVQSRFIEQSSNQEYVASRCGRSLTWFFNDRSAARYFNDRQPLVPPVMYRRFVCSVDSDEPKTLTP